MRKNSIKHYSVVLSFSIVVTILCAAVMISGCTDYETYTHEYFGFSIKYPDTWVVDKLSFVNPETESTVYINIIDSSTPRSLEEIVKSYNRDRFDINQGKFTTFKDCEAYEIEYTDLVDKTQYNCKTIIFIHEDKAYILLYYSKQVNYEDDLKTANKIIDSFTFI